jgi:hypothetical protein
MKTGSVKSMVFSPPAHRVAETRHLDEQAAKEADPEEAVLLYGRMLGDVQIIAEELRGLLFSESEYRSRLRVVVSASTRLAERAARLLGEKP